MGGSSSQVIWKQRYNSMADAALSQALATLQCQLRELPSQQWGPHTASIGGVRDYQCSYVSPAAAEWSSVLLQLGAHIGDQLASELSRITSAPSILFSEYDEATWGYALFLAGSESDRFWSVPEIVEVDAADARGNPSLVSEVFSVPESSIAAYLQHVSSDLPETAKAFPEDEFDLANHWVRVDFMRRIGIQYPIPGKTPGGRHVQIVEPAVPATRQTNQATSATAKPRWKFWR